VTPPTTFRLIEGELYSFNFPKSPAGRGVFLGIVEPIGYLAFEVADDAAGDPVKFLNPAQLAALRPETWGTP
jgi:hypothetical protein